MQRQGSNRMLMVGVNFFLLRAGGAGTPVGPDLLRELPLLPQLTGSDGDGWRRPPVSDTDRHDFPAMFVPGQAAHFP